MTVRADGSDAADVGAALRGALQIGHLAGVPAIEPFAKNAQLGKIRGRRDAADIEPELARLRLDRCSVMAAGMLSTGRHHGARSSRDVVPS